MPKTAMFNYKCRQCGKIYADSGCHIKLAKAILQDIVYDWDLADAEFVIKPKMIEIHNCGDSKQGVADLIGISTNKK